MRGLDPEMERILRRRPEVSQAEIDDLRRRVLARLIAAPEEVSDEPLPNYDAVPAHPAEAHAAVPAFGWLLFAPEDEAAGTVDDQGVASAADGRHGLVAVGPGTGARGMSDSDATEPTPVGVVVAEAEQSDGRLLEVGAGPSPSGARQEPDTSTASWPSAPPDEAASGSAIAAAASPRRGRKRRTADSMTDTLDQAAAAASAYCPYCARLLEPVPETSGECSRCRQVVVVRHVDGRTVYLAESVLPFFDAERRRLEESERCRVERDEWLALARAAGASNADLDVPTPEYVTAAEIEAARVVYLAAVERSVNLARNERRWAAAARTRFEQAHTLLARAGSPATLPEVVMQAHQDGLAAELEGLGEVVKEAELHGTSCCEACRIDDGRIVQIADELTASTLPHQGCPTGLCGCRWLLSRRDHERLQEFLRRQMEAYQSIS
jgi:hypothetical protein